MLALAGAAVISMATEGAKEAEDDGATVPAPAI
jgi:hypothetical protein